MAYARRHGYTFVQYTSDRYVNYFHPLHFSNLQHIQGNSYFKAVMSKVIIMSLICHMLYALYL